MRRVSDRQVFWLSAAICAVLLLKHLLVPLNPDNDTYQAMAWQLYEYGRLPYLGSWDQNFPGIVYLHWLSMALFGNSTIAFRSLDAIFHVANALLLFSLTRRLSNGKIAATASLLYVLYYTHDSFWLAGQRDGFAVTFVLGALWVYYRRQDALKWLSIGLLLGVATVIRPTFGLFAIAILVIERVPFKEMSRRSVHLAIGAAAIWVLQFFPYVIVEGGLDEYYLATIRFTADLYGDVALPWSNLLLWNRAQKIYFTILFVGAAVLIVRRRRLLSADPEITRMIIVLLIASALPVFVMRKFSIYHWDPLFTLLTPVCAYLLIETSRTFGNYKAIAFVVLLGIVAFRLFPRHVVKEYLMSPAQVGSRLHHVHDRIDHDSLYGDVAERALAHYINARTSATDAIEIASIWPGASWMSERRRASRFTTWYALAMQNDGRQTDYQQRWQREYVDSIRTATPAFIAIASGPRSFLLDRESEPASMFMRLPGMSELMSSEYQFDTVLRGYQLYKRIATER